MRLGMLLGVAAEVGRGRDDFATEQGRDLAQGGGEAVADVDDWCRWVSVREGGRG